MTVAQAMRTNLKALRAAQGTQGLPLPVMDHNRFADLLETLAERIVEPMLARSVAAAATYSGEAFT